MGAGKPAPIESEFIPRFASTARQWEPGLPAMASARSFSCTALIAAQASRFLHKASSPHVSRAPHGLWEPGLPAITSARSFSCTALLASQASQLLQKASSSHVSRAPQVWEPGLPAMASARSLSCTALIASQASQLPPLLLQCFSYGCPPPDSPPTALACRFPSAHRVRSDD